MARRNIAHTEAGTADVASDVYRVPIADYTDPARWQAEVDRIFKRVPLMLAFAGELPAAGTYKAMEVVGVPVLIVRGEGAVLSAFVNMCSHRGAIVVPDGLGKGVGFRARTTDGPTTRPASSSGSPTVKPSESWTPRRSG